MSIKTSIKTKIATLAVAALVATGGVAASTQAAHAGSDGALIGAGILGAVVLGAAIAASSPPAYSYGYGYQPHRYCDWRPQYNAFGQFMGHARVCH
ncbi:MAG: hypothetical protein R3D69_00600 [Xanthobacteraceae bacterium]